LQISLLTATLDQLSDQLSSADSTDPLPSPFLSLRFPLPSPYLSFGFGGYI